MLAALLDGQVPEIEAVRFAGESTANAVFRRRAAKVCSLLNQGIKLPEAIRVMDDAGELRWRLANALQSSGVLFARWSAGTRLWMPGFSTGASGGATHHYGPGFAQWGDGREHPHRCVSGFDSTAQRAVLW